jgi:Divergent InlB B-repeat domain
VSLARRLRAVVPASVLLVVLVVPGAPAAQSRSLPLTVTISGNGTVRFNGGRQVTCAAASCKRTLPVRAGSKVTLTTQPGTGWKFGAWAGACRGTASSCKVRMTRAVRVGVTFIPPGDRANPYPIGESGALGNGWKIQVVSVTPNANDQVVAYQGGFVNQPPPPGAQDFMAQVTLTYTGGGSSNAFDTVLDWLRAEGSHNAGYAYYSCGVPPPPNFEDVSGDLFSGQGITGNVCFQIAANDADSLLMNVDSVKPVWFALR